MTYYRNRHVEVVGEASDGAFLLGGSGGGAGGEPGKVLSSFQLDLPSNQNTRDDF
jgi:hypothetical protein